MSTDSLHQHTYLSFSPLGGLFAALARLINTAGLVSVDLADTIFASLPRRDGAPYETVVRSNCSE